MTLTHVNPEMCPKSLRIVKVKLQILGGDQVQAVESEGFKIAVFKNNDLVSAPLFRRLTLEVLRVASVGIFRYTSHFRQVLFVQAFVTGKWASHIPRSYSSDIFSTSFEAQLLRNSLVDQTGRRIIDIKTQGTKARVVPRPPS